MGNIGSKAKRGRPKGKSGKPTKGHGYKFRISYRTTLRGSGKVGEAGFSYQTLKSARRGYKAILLGLYRSKEVAAFAICLNRCRDPKWRKAIHKETVNGIGQRNN